MAWSLQNQCAVEEDFEDEDFLSAVEDAETSFHGFAPTVPRCLRPISSHVQSPSRAAFTAHRGSDEGMRQNVNSMSPVLDCLTNSRLIVGMTVPSKTTSSLRPAGQGRLQSTTCMSFRSSREGFTTSEDVFAVPSKSANSNKQPFHHSVRSGRQSTTAEEMADDGLDDDLLLSACTELEKPSINFNPSKKGEVNLKLQNGSPAQATHREKNNCDEPVSKKLREDSQRAMPDPGIFLRGAECQKSDATLINSPYSGVPCYTSLNLRPSSASEMQSSSIPAASCTGTVVQNVPLSSKATQSFGIVSGYQVARSVLKSGPPSQVEVNSTHQNPKYLCPVRSPSESRTLRASTLPSPVPSGQSPRVPGSIFQQPPRRPHDSCALMSSIASPSSSPRVPCGSSAGPNNLHPVMTNHLVQLVTAANQTPQASSRSSLRSKSRRFPGPAGILPQQPNVTNLEEILVSTPHTPTHGAVAKMRSQEESSSQLSVEEEFGRGPWITMKTELGIDEKNPTCFLQLYSVIMVLRKAALKQLPKNKVPNMAVMLKSLVRSNVDASAVFRDPTGEMQGTLHHLLLEERENDLKAGSVLLLQQVGVFSPSSRNHYLNVTPNNVVKIYPADGISQSPELQEAQNPLLFRAKPSIGAGVNESQGRSFRSISQNELKCNTNIEASPVMSRTLNSLSLTHKSHSEDGGPTGDWDMDDDLDSLMGELPEDSLFGGGKSSITPQSC